MPEIDSFLGLAFYMYYFDNQQHQQPYLHIQYAEFELVIAIETTECLQGFLPRKQRKVAEQFIQQHRQQLMHMWNKAVKGEYIGKLEEQC